MYRFSICLLFVAISLGSATVHADCYNAASEGYDGYRDAKKAYRASDLSSCQRYAKKAYRHFSYAESEASSCNCSSAEMEAYDGYRDARKAYRASSLSDCQRYAKKAYRHGSDVESYANSC